MLQSIDHARCLINRFFVSPKILLCCIQKYLSSSRSSGRRYEQDGKTDSMRSLLNALENLLSVICYKLPSSDIIMESSTRIDITLNYCLMRKYFVKNLSCGRNG